MMSREDVLRELELLPLWQLRVPATPPIEGVQKIADVKAVVKTELKAVEIAENAQALPVAETSYYVVVAEEKNWAFVLPEALTGAAETLFNNILLALQINKMHTETLANLADIKVIVAMGEIVAQQLLNSVEPIETLRGTRHVFKSVAGNITLVATYHPNDLLQHLVCKPKMWDDLCLANSLAAT